MTQMNLPEKQKQTHRLRVQTCCTLAVKGKGEGGRNGLGAQD